MAKIEASLDDEYKLTLDGFLAQEAGTLCVCTYEDAVSFSFFSEGAIYLIGGLPRLDSASDEPRVKGDERVAICLKSWSIRRPACMTAADNLAEFRVLRPHEVVKLTNTIG